MSNGGGDYISRRFEIFVGAYFVITFLLGVLVTILALTYVRNNSIFPRDLPLLSLGWRLAGIIVAVTAVFALINIFCRAFIFEPIIERVEDELSADYSGESTPDDTQADEIGPDMIRETIREEFQDIQSSSSSSDTDTTETDLEESTETDANEREKEGR